MLVVPDRKNEIGDINNYTPIALFDDVVVYNYIDERGALVIGNYDFSSKKYSDTASVEEFYISSGKNGIVEFYCFDGYIYIRNFSDYGVIGKIENNQIKTVLELPNLRMAYNGKNTQDDYYGFFVRGGRELYFLDVYADILYKTSLELSQDESIRNAISDGKNICISILDERDTESFTTKKTIHYIP